jgi:serine/threonine protein phosphatase PrpC
LQNRNHEQDEFLVLACDGIWDVRSNQECVTELALLFQEGETNVGLICEEVRVNIHINYWLFIIGSTIVVGSFFLVWLSHTYYIYSSVLRASDIFISFEFQHLDICLRLGSKDNMTTLVVKFKAQTVGDGGGVVARRKEREGKMTPGEQTGEQGGESS